MATPVLNALVSAGIAPSIYAESAFVGNGGLICANDPATGLQISRQKGASGGALSNELLAVVNRDLNIKGTLPVSGTLTVAGIAMPSATTAGSAGNGLQQCCGVASIPAGSSSVTVYCDAIGGGSQVFLEKKLVNTSGQTAATTDAGGLVQFVTFTGTFFQVQLTTAATGAALVALQDVSFYWMLINPIWGNN